MSEFSELEAKLKARITQLSQMIEQSLANHNALLGMLKASNDILAEITSVANSVAPSSGVTEVLNAAEEIASVVESVAQPASPSDIAVPVEAGDTAQPSS